MFPTYARRSYKGKKRFRKKAPTVGGMRLGVKLKVARRKSMDYLDRLGEWIKKAGGTNGFHAKPGRKVQAKQFKVHGSFKKKSGTRAETFTQAGSTSN